MQTYKKSNLVIYSDFEIRKIREENKDIDLLIPIDLRVLNLHIQDMPEYISDRFQFTQVRNMIIRFTTNDENNYCTLHLLKDIDLHSAMVNFTVDYSQHHIKVVKADYSVEMYIQKKFK